MIKKYKHFIKENADNLGEWVENYSDDDYVKNIINRFIKDIDPTIRVANSINLLDDHEQADIKSQIEDYLANGIEDKETSVDVRTIIDDEIDDENMEQLNKFNEFSEFKESVDHDYDTTFFMTKLKEKWKSDDIQTMYEEEKTAWSDDYKDGSGFAEDVILNKLIGWFESKYKALQEQVYDDVYNNLQKEFEFLKIK